jgi:alpha-D-ribose 1-methylphosphonate 5-triphosphate synthase subunit PhnL
VVEIRRETIGYVSQFLRVVPRVSALDVAAEPLVQRGSPIPERGARKRRPQRCFSRLNLPETLWALPPATFSGGEQQRVNIARGFITDHPVLSARRTDGVARREEPAGGDRHDSEKKARPASALLGIFHDQDVREVVADAIIDVTEVRGVERPRDMMDRSISASNL